MADWNFFTNYAHILFLLAQEPDLTIKDISNEVGITERRTQKIITDLTDAGFVKVTKIGRKNHYDINGDKNLRHPIEKECRIDQLIELIKKGGKQA